MLAVARSEARIKEVKVAGGVGQRHGYIGEPGQLTQAAQAFLVVRPFAGARIEPHFHDVDQFQVVVEGDGRIGKKQVRPITFQYADAFTPYGPIIAADRGLSFFTLRNIASGGFWAMPGNKHEMPGRAGRNIEGVFDLEAGVPAVGEVVREILMPPQADGVQAVGIRLGAGARDTGIPHEGKGQFYLVCTGSLIVDGKALPERSVVRVEPEDAGLVLTAGPEGAQVLALQFCAPCDRPGTDPTKLASRSEKGYVNLRAPGN
ncbi:MAG: hypothetical protein SFW09_18155 [Hyphomicrobiaceae bacterium]|nr:hypothetical protein [Hyphomicrobiaceae bacterium]